MKIPTWLWLAGAYLLLRSKGEEGPDVIPPKPAKPTPKVSGDSWAATGTALVLQPDTRYFARLALSGLESAGATSSDIRDKFKSIGFRDVYVWMDKTPSNMPDGARGKPGPFAMGTWNGAAQTANLPRQVAEVWMES